MAPVARCGHQCVQDHAGDRVRQLALMVAVDLIVAAAGFEAGDEVEQDRRTARNGGNP